VFNNAHPNVAPFGDLKTAQTLLSEKEEQADLLDFDATEKKPKVSDRFKNSQKFKNVKVDWKKKTLNNVDVQIGNNE